MVGYLSSTRQDPTLGNPVGRPGFNYFYSTLVKCPPPTFLYLSLLCPNPHTLQASTPRLFNFNITKWPRKLFPLSQKNTPLYLLLLIKGRFSTLKKERNKEKDKERERRILHVKAGRCSIYIYTIDKMEREGEGEREREREREREMLVWVSQSCCWEGWFYEHNDKGMLCHALPVTSTFPLILPLLLLEIFLKYLLVL